MELGELSSSFKINSLFNKHRQIDEHALLDSNGDASDADQSACIKSDNTAADGEPSSEPIVENNANPQNDPRNTSTTAQFSIYSFASQVFPSFILSGLGMVFSGFVLHEAKKLPQFIPELVMILPTLMGLKGNLEMSLASRISTEANLGHLKDKIESAQAITANLVLVQVQAMIVAFIASILCVTSSWISRNAIGSREFLLVVSSSCSTASLAGFVVGMIICGIVMLSYFYDFNPDNLATPLAAGLGDLTTLLVLIGTCSLYYWAYNSSYKWFIYCMLLVHFLLFCPLLVYAYRNSWSRPTLLHGWSPILAAMLLGILIGRILEFASSKYKDLVLFLVVMNGTGGNIVSVQASRLCTRLSQIDAQLMESEQNRVQAMSSYLATEISTKPLSEREATRMRRNVYNEEVVQLRRLLWGSSLEAKAARMLVALVVPSHVVLLTISWLFPHGKFHFSIPFVIVYLIGAIVQVTALLIMAGFISVFSWRRGQNPDDVCVPYLTALADLFGTLCLWAVFTIVSNKGKEP